MTISSNSSHGCLQNYVNMNQPREISSFAFAASFAGSSFVTGSHHFLSRMHESANFIKSRINNLVFQMKKISLSAPQNSRLHYDLKEAHRNVYHTGWLLGDIVQLPHAGQLEDSVPKLRRWLGTVIEQCLMVSDQTGQAYAKTVITPMMELRAEFDRLTDTPEYKDLLAGLKQKNKI